VEWLTEAASLLAGLVVGLLIGWFGHVLSIRRTKSERAIADATELWDRCADIATARAQYILAYHRRAPNAQHLNEEHRSLKRRYRWADPEVILKGTPEWEAYHAAEVAARTDKAADLKSRIKVVEQTSYALLQTIGERRADARK
jgi:hypothetical protein